MKIISTAQGHSALVCNKGSIGFSLCKSPIHRLKPMLLSGSFPKNGWLCSTAKVVFVVLFFIVFCTAQARALQKQEHSQHIHQGHNSPAVKNADRKNVITKKTIPDVELLSQDGRKIDFYKDLLKGKTVVISFIYTSCTNVCPMLGANLAKLQVLLGDRPGKDIHLISVSSDPVTDTPERLKAWAKRFGEKAGWTLVTGAKADIDKLSIALTGSVADKGMHEPVILIGNQDKGVWKSVFGLAEPERLLEMLQQVTEQSTGH
jgi:cytochrome oxidase Cu insertion factor (SCO1/SenC/PrrC family)